MTIKMVVGNLRTPASGASEAVHFSSGNYFKRGSIYGSGTRVGIISVWFKMGVGTDGTRNDAFYLGDDPTGASRVLLLRTTGNNWRLLCRDLAFGTVIDITSSATYTVDSAYHHLIASWNANTSTAQMRIDNVDVAGTPTTNASDIAADICDETGVGANTDGSNQFTGDLAFLYVNLAEALDLSVASNVQKFRSSGGVPVSLGSDGSTPTGNQPQVYMHGTPSNWTTQNGSGGSFTMVGTVSQSSADPP